MENAIQRRPLLWYAEKERERRVCVCTEEKSKIKFVDCYTLFTTIYANVIATCKLRVLVSLDHNHIWMKQKSSEIQLNYGDATECWGRR